MLTFNQLYKSYTKDVFRFVFWLSGNRTWAEYISSETMIRAWAHFQPIRTEILKVLFLLIAVILLLGLVGAFVMMFLRPV